MKLSVVAAALASAVALCECSTKMVIGYFPNWLYANYPVENIPFEKYTHINYAFAILNNPDDLPSFPDESTVEHDLPELVESAHGKNTKVILSIGGWTGSQRFSTMVSTEEKRKKFIQWNMDFINKYKTDGVDIDWEYPGKQAAGCNEYSENDADNFLQLLKEFRSELDKKYPKDHKEISMAVHVQPFVKSGTPMTNVTEFVPYFDHINLMTYDINGAWADQTGPNAPFMAQEGKGAQFSFVDSIREWKKAGVPASKMTAGLSFYGRAMKAETDMSKDPHQYHKASVGAPKGDSDDTYWTDDYCSKDTPGLSGIWKWTNLREEGILKEDMVTTDKGWKRYWDDITKTPWLFNPTSKNYISYDDPTSLGIKVQHALCEDLAGVMVWDIHQDNGELVEVVNRIHDPVPEQCDGPDFYLTAHNIKQKEIKSNDKNKNNNYDDDESDNYDNTDNVDDDKYDDYVNSNTPYVSAVKVPEKNGSRCSISGQEKCVQSGVSPQWLTCNIDKWLIRDCSTGLVCVESTGFIYCDHPPKNSTTPKVSSPSSKPSSLKIISSTTKPSLAKSTTSAKSSSVSKTSSKATSSDESLSDKIVSEAEVIELAAEDSVSIPEESVLVPEVSEPTTEESEPASDEPVPASEESEPAPSEPVIAPEESEPVSKESIPASEESGPAPSESVIASEESEPASEPVPASEESGPAPSESVIATKESEPVSEESIPASDEPVPTTEESEPASEESIPVSEESKPASEESILASEESEPAPSESVIAPGESEPVPTTEESEPVSEESEPASEPAPASEESGPAPSESVIAPEESEPVSKESIPASDEPVPTTEESESAPEEFVEAAIEDSVPISEESAPAIEKPVSDVPVPASEESESAPEEFVEAAIEDSVPISEESAPAIEKPVSDVPVPASEESEPASDKLAPDTNELSDSEDTVVPGEPLPLAEPIEPAPIVQPVEPTSAAEALDSENPSPAAESDLPVEFTPVVAPDTENGPGTAVEWK